MKPYAGGSCHSVVAGDDALSAANTPRDGAAAQRSWLLSVDGTYLTGGFMILNRDRPTTTACVTELTRPGVFLDAHFGRGVRSFLLAIQDGRMVRVELERTSCRGVRGRLYCFALGDLVAATDLHQIWDQI